MKNTIKNGVYACSAFGLLALNQVNAISFSKSNSISSNLQGSSKSADLVIESWVQYLIGFLYLVAFIMMVYGAFNILTASGDEEKVKKGKTILIQAVAGIIVVFIANSIITWVISGLFNSGTNLT